MNTLFLSNRYRAEEIPRASEFKKLIESHCLECVTGEVLGGEPVWDEVSRLVYSADALIALFLNPMVPND